MENGSIPVISGMGNYMTHMPLTRLIISLGESLADWQPVEWRQTHNDRLPLSRWAPDGHSLDWWLKVCPWWRLKLWTRSWIGAAEAVAWNIKSQRKGRATYFRQLTKLNIRMSNYTINSTKFAGLSPRLFTSMLSSRARNRWSTHHHWLLYRFRHFFKSCNSIGCAGMGRE